ncbi:MAG: hypothetical protein AB1750_00645 [Chloroflexota bacterium]
MKSALNHVALFVAKAQKYLPLAWTAYAVIAVLIFRNPPEGDGGPGG